MFSKTSRIPPWRAALDGPTLLIAIVHSMRRFPRVWLLDTTNVKAGWCWPPLQITRRLLRLDP